MGVQSKKQITSLVPDIYKELENRGGWDKDYEV